MERNYIRLTGTVERKQGYYIATIHELPLAVQGQDRDGTISEILKALTAYLEANKRLGQMDSVANQTGYSGQNPEERFDRLLSALRDHTKAIEQKGEVTHPVKRITWEPGNSGAEQKFVLELVV